MGAEAKERWLAAGERHSSVGLVEAVYRRDQAAFGTVLGSALALRLFLFVIPANVAIIALTSVVGLDSLLQEHFEASATTGPMAVALRDMSWPQALWVFLSGLVLAAWAGRSLARVLATTSGTSWGMTMARSKQSLPAMAALVGVLMAMVFASAIFGELRAGSGIAFGTLVWMAVFATVAAAWFVVMLTLPRDTSDPGALIPGAALFGIGYTVLQWFMQYYLPLRVERTSDTLGQLATTVATLGNFFIIGRLMSATLVISAVVYEEHGSLSRLFFALPLIRRIPARFPSVARYFALDGAPDAPADDDAEISGRDGSAV